MAKEGGNLPLALRALASLTDGWAVPDALKPPSMEEGGLEASVLGAQTEARHGWQWKEGRLLAEELVLNCTPLGLVEELRKIHHVDATDARALAAAMRRPCTP